MGNIRPSFIKLRALRLIEEHPDAFNADFEHNKAMVEKCTDLSSSTKKMRNWIAGYVTRRMKRPRID